MAKTAVDILRQPELAEEAKADLEKKLDGRKYKTIIPEDVRPGMIK